MQQTGGEGGAHESLDGRARVFMSAARS